MIRMRGLASALSGLRHRISLTAHLVIFSLFVTVGAVGVVQAWSLMNVHEEENLGAQRDLEINLRLLQLLTGQLGQDWRLEGTQLRIGDVLVNGNNALVDRVKEVAGGVATIFAGDTRVATNVTRPDGTRGIGTKLAPGPAYEAAIRQGRSYRGENEILGRRHLTIYEPIRDRAGQQVGLLFVGIPLQETEMRLAEFRRNSLIGAVVTSLAASLLLLLALRRLLRPLGALARSVRQIGEGDLETEVPCQARGDQLGEIGRALSTLQDAARRARALEATAAGERERGPRRRRRWRRESRR
jgi:methyl-accepting chemotaxis protein